MTNVDDALLPDGWLILKAGRGWYRPNAQGYTSDPLEAGRYTYDKAMDYLHPNGLEGPRDGIEIHHESEVPGAIARAGQSHADAGLLAALEATVNVAVAYAQGTGSQFDRVIAQARAAIAAAKGEKA